MRKIVSKFFKRLLALVTVPVCLVYLTTVFIPYIDTGKYWYISIIGLGFLILFFMLCILLVVWLIVRSRFWAILCLVILLAGYQQVRAAIAFNFPKDFSLEKPTGTLRVMQWNVHNWNQIKFENEKDFDMQAWPHMMELIRNYNPDVLCTEEFYENENRKKLPSNIATLEKMGYKYHYFLNHGKFDGEYYVGIAIFSKYPIKESGEVQVAEKSNADPLAYADVDVDGKRIRVIALHLQSVEFESEQYQNLQNLKKAQKPDVQESRTIISKLKKGFQRRYGQAESVNGQIAASPYPVIVCADLNDVPNSGSYFAISRNLQDTFLKKGTFVGRTFRFISPTLRIDYILADKSFRVEQFIRIKAAYSDHYPLVTDLRF